MRRLCFSITVLVAAVMLKHNLRADDELLTGPPAIVHLDDDPPPFHLGHRTIDELPPLTDDELGSPTQQALLQALGGDPYGHRAADHARAGCTMLVRPHAIPSNTPHYGFYYVGGSKALWGDCRQLDEGTFGWDYSGILFNKRVALTWTHGRRWGGGTGAYKTDGPRLRHE
jgi:hypothetical protein